nr:BspA family leucine-rich repeat surface protein [uncultured Allomuricauda sp.]
MKIRNLIYGIVFLGLLWSCGKDDGPTPAEEKNNAPKIEAQSFTVTEDISDAITIGTVKAEDADNDELTFSITDSNLFEISHLGDLSLAEGVVLDFETSQQHIVKVNVTDNINEPIETEVTVNVENVAEAIPEDPTSFVTTWKTSENGESIRMGLVEALEYDFAINWGDGNIENVSTVPVDHLQAIFHDYEVAGDYTVSIIGKLPGVVMGIYGAQTNLISIEQWGDINWKTMTSAYANCENVVCNATDVPNLSQVTNIDGMFYGTLNFEGDLSDWDVSTITNMSYTFDLSNFNGDISKWDTQNVTSMESMFRRSAFNGDISGWDTQNVTSMRTMFLGASFNGDLSGWNTENVTDMYAMFANASFNEDISGWNTQNVMIMHSMFKGNSSFNSDIGSWNTENVTTMAEMFNGAESFNQDLGLWNIQSVEDMSGMFINSGLSTLTYGGALIGWVSQENIPVDIILGANNVDYCTNSQAAAARETLINDFSWTFSDDTGVDCN